MATYKEIHGVKVQYRDSDATAVEGDVWYNSSTGKLKVHQSSGSWATGNNLNSARQSPILGGGTQTSGICAGGWDGNKSALSEEYNGTSWAEGNNINTARAYLNGCGAANTAALAFGGDTHPPTPNRRSALNESYDGTSWTETGDLNTARNSGGSFGSQTSAMMGGGSYPDTAVCETWDDLSDEAKALTSGRPTTITLP